MGTLGYSGCSIFSPSFSRRLLWNEQVPLCTDLTCPCKALKTFSVTPSAILLTRCVLWTISTGEAVVVQSQPSLPVDTGVGKEGSQDAAWTGFSKTEEETVKDIQLSLSYYILIFALIWEILFDVAPFVFVLQKKMDFKVFLARNIPCTMSNGLGTISVRVTALLLFLCRSFGKRRIGGSFELSMSSVN